MIFWGRKANYQCQNRSKIDVKNDVETGLVKEAHFDRFSMNFGAILASQNGAKTLQNRC